MEICIGIVLTSWVLGKGNSMSASTLSDVQSDEKQIKVFYSDDPDPLVAGQGLAYAPFIKDIVGSDDLGYWMMSPAEQVGLTHILQNRRPKVSIEIGTRLGGSLQVLAKFSEKVYSLDINPDVPRVLAGKHPNVEYRVGSSTETLPALLKQLSDEGAEVGFVLVDGDHSTEGVRADIDNILKYVPRCPLYITMHDSSNPAVRRGLKGASWSACPHIQFVELDFIPGHVNPSPQCSTQLWGGLCLALMTPERRQGRFEVTGRAELNVKFAHSALRVFRKRVMKKLGVRG